MLLQTLISIDTKFGVKSVNSNGGAVTLGSKELAFLVSSSSTLALISGVILRASNEQISSLTPRLAKKLQVKKKNIIKVDATGPLRNTNIPVSGFQFDSENGTDTREC